MSLVEGTYELMHDEHMSESDAKIIVGKKEKINK